jgi:hypothetical protein
MKEGERSSSMEDPGGKQEDEGRRKGLSWKV